MATGSFIGVGSFKGYWNANTNSGSADYLNIGQPLLASSGAFTEGYTILVDPAQVASVGDYWQVNVAGSTLIDDINTWNLNDWVVYQSSSATGMTWNRLSVTDTIAATVIGDASQSGLKNTLLASASANSGPSIPGGQFGEVLFCSASNADGLGTNKYLTGNSNFTFDPSPHAQLLNLTGSFRVLQAGSPGLAIAGDTKFGDSAGDQHQFTGSITCTIGITSSTNVQAAYFEGDGSRLTGISAGSTGNPVYVDAAQYRVPHWGAADGGGDFGLTGSANLSFFTTTNALQVTGAVCSTNMYVANSILHEGDADTSIDFSTNQIDLTLDGYPFASFSNTEAVFNPDSETYSFQIMGTDHQDTFYLNGPSNNIGIRCIPTGAIEALMVSGSVKLGDTIAAYNAMTGTFELTGNLGINTPATTYSLALPNVDSPPGRAMAYAWSTYSSARYKDNVATMSNPIETAKKLRGVEFTWKNSGNKDFGFIAEEVGKVLPQLVAYENDGHTATGMDYSKITSLLIECVKSQQDQIETQEERIKYLEKKFKP